MNAETGCGCIIAAPQSGSGKTTITLGLLRALKRSGIVVKPAKAGPDFIDPAFHHAACGDPSVNLDPWAMRGDLLRSLAATQDFLLVEAMMGLFDGAADGSGSAADLAAMLELPVVLVVDAARQSHSVAALVRGFRDHRNGIHIAGVILNRVGSVRHEKMLREALNSIGMPVLGSVPRDDALVLPSRHLGLVQALENDTLATFVDHAADVIERSVDLPSIVRLGAMRASATQQVASLKPPGQHIAIARDKAFSFSYPHLLDGWRDAGAELTFFSPLANDAPDPKSDAVYLPGGYPELHAGLIADNSTFFAGLIQAADGGAFIYGECGGYMVLGEGLIDSDGHRHKMANLLPLVTSFESPKMHLGYRVAKTLSPLPFAQTGGVMTAHEFHYSTALKEGDADRLFSIHDARGESLGNCGLRVGNVAGSYIHLIDRRTA